MIARPDLARWRSPLLLAVVTASGLAVVKWGPYAGRLISKDLGFGPSLLDAQPLEYAVSYLASVWPAMVLGIVMAAAVEAALPRTWIVELLGRASLRSSAIGGLASLPTMLCTCCAAPVAVGLRRNGTAPGAALAFWLGSPLLNPAVLVFLALALPWPFAALRLIAGVGLVFGACHLVGRLAPRSSLPQGPWADPADARARPFVAIALRYARVLLPEWIVLGLVVGVARAWLLPQVPALGANDPAALAAAALGGTLFMIPTAGEIPIAQALLGLGLGAGPVAALVVTLPALSLPSLAMVRGAFPPRVLVATTALVIVVGALAGAAAVALRL